MNNSPSYSLVKDWFGMGQKFFEHDATTGMSDRSEHRDNTHVTLSGTIDQTCLVVLFYQVFAFNLITTVPNIVAFGPENN